MDKKEIKRKKMAKAARTRRRKRRKKAVMAGRIAAAVLLAVVIGGGGAFLYHSMPEMKIARRLEAADEYVETKDYEEAIASCEEALQIDSNSVKAYRAMAGVYLTKEDREAAEQVLYRGWETTQDESLLQEYCVHLLNDAVADINAGNCSLLTLDKCVSALEQDPGNTDSYALLDACYERLFEGEETELFCTVYEDGGQEEGMPEDGSGGFDKYLELMNRMLAVYRANPLDELKKEIIKFAVPNSGTVWFDTGRLQDYQNLLGQVAAIGDEGKLTELTACLEKALWAQDTFAEAFRIFESGEFGPIKDFMQSEAYLLVRDQFIAGTMEYWDGKTYIPVSKEKMKLTKADGQWKFSFADFDEYPEAGGVIKVWGAKQEDAGVQRICISYEPAPLNEQEYPHYNYEFIYLYSNVKINGVLVPQMNYRFETRITTQEGTVSEVIGDWGGEHEWSMEY